MPLSSPRPLVSVILPICNGERYLPAAIRSVLDQEGDASLELVAVDDGSTDLSADLVAGIGDPRIRLFRQENRGISATRNAAIRRSRGAYLAFLDQDDRWLREKLAVQIPLFAEDPRVGLVHCQSARIDGEGCMVNPGPVLARGRLSGDVRREVLTGNCVPGTAGVVVRRECFDRVGLFDESLNGADDWEMWGRIAAEYRFRFIPRILCHTRLHGTNTSRDLERMKPDALRARDMLFANPRLVRGFPPSLIRRLRSYSMARIHAFCGIQLIRAGHPGEAVTDLRVAWRNHPGKPRYWILLAFAILGSVPTAVRRRML